MNRDGGGVSRWRACEAGRLGLRPDPERWIAAAVAGLGLREAPLTAAIALESCRLSLPTRDPADRFIAATAGVHACSLVTADLALGRVTGVRVVFCRPPKRRRQCLRHACEFGFSLMSPTGTSVR